MQISNQFDCPVEKRKRLAITSCSVCISTYKRAQLLEKLLVSLQNQLLPPNVQVEIIVVDNDPEKSGQHVVKRFKNTRNIRINYFTQPLKSISLTRNLAVAKASGEYILFIDDDEVASPCWIRYMIETLHKYNADGVFGPVVSEFNPTTPEWMRRKDFFHHDVPATGLKAEDTWTGNCLIKAALLKKMAGPFEVKYGMMGGEDTDLFEKLEAQGAKFVYCREARATEYLPPDRTCLSYLFLRSLRYGNGHTCRRIHSAGKAHIFVRLFMVGKAMLYGPTAVFLMTIFAFSVEKRVYWLMRIASNIGRFLAAFGWRYQWY